MSLTVDHAVYAWPDHGEIRAACERVGLEPTFGGEHDTGDTQMSLVGFPDGSYLELMAPTEPGTEPDRWAGLVDHWAGPATWCVRDDVRERLTRAIGAGVPVEGPHTGSRTRPDGTLVEWVSGRYGPHEWRSVLPFAIRDRTPHRFRVPDATVADGPLTGVAEVVLGVEAVEQPARWFRRLHDFPTPVDVETPLSAAVSSVPGQPVAFAVPYEGSRLAERVAVTDQQPVAFLLGTDDFDAARDRYDLAGTGRWDGHRVAWFDADPLRDQVGVVETA